MTIGRLSIHSPIWGFFFAKDTPCGCILLWTVLGSFTWHDKQCVCGACDRFICHCDENDGSQDDDLSV